jgi:hypothetical protein
MVGVCWFGTLAHAQFVEVEHFDSGISAVGMGVDPTNGDAWVYDSFGATIRRYSALGVPMGSVPRPGESANDADVEFTVAPMTLGTTSLPTGTLLFINGESDVAEVYAIDKSTGSVLATLITDFGASHVVGGAQHPERGTIFLVQDHVPGATSLRNRIAEIDPATGDVLNTFVITDVASSFTVNFGDIEVTGGGNLAVVSSHEDGAILELTPDGAFVALRTHPATNSCGIGIVPESCEFRVVNTSGRVTTLGGIDPGNLLCDYPCDDLDFNGDGVFPDIQDVNDFIAVFGGGTCPTGTCDDIDFNNDGVLPDSQDLLDFIFVFGGGTCPS